MILGYPIPELFLFFVFYSFLGWLMETCYCSLRRGKLVDRGFLYGPVCPIYGVGVLLMILFFTPLKGNIPLFYATAVVVMTSWEYFVGWLLETTTHVKYWDYSNSKFNLHGRVCLWVALTWGALSYVVIFWIHPPVERLYERLPLPLVCALCLALGAALAVDMSLTVRQLALISKLVVGVTRAGEELQLQMALGKAELSDKLAESREKLDDRLAQNRAAFSDRLLESREKLDDAAQQLQDRYRDQLAQLEKYSRRFRAHYDRISVSDRFHVSHLDLMEMAERAKKKILGRGADGSADSTAETKWK